MDLTLSFSLGAAHVIASIRGVPIRVTLDLFVVESDEVVDDISVFFQHSAGHHGRCTAMMKSSERCRKLRASEVRKDQRP